MGYSNATTDGIKRAVHLITVHRPFDTRIFHKQAKTLVDAGYVVTLIAQHARDEVVDGVKIKALPKPRNRFSRIFGLTWRAFRLALYQRASVYHFHDPELLPAGLLLKLFTRAKLIYDVHENVPKQILNKSWLPTWSRQVVVLAYKSIEKIVLPFIDKLIIAEDSYIENYLGRKNVIVVRNYPIREHFASHCRDTGSTERKSSNFRVTYVGGVSKSRGALEMVHALRILITQGRQDIILNMIGPLTPSKLWEELNALIKQFSLENNIYIPGPIPYDKIRNILAQSDIGAVILHPNPNYVYSLPTKLFEYMAAGLPVIASNFPLWREIVEGNSCGLCVDPLKPEEIARAVEYLLTHPAEAYRMGQNGRRAVEEKYNWKNEAKKLIELYESILMRS